MTRKKNDLIPTLYRATIVGFAVFVGYHFGSRRTPPPAPPWEHGLQEARHRRATEGSAGLIEERFPLAPAYPTRQALLASALSSVQAPGGLYCEFGVASGSTINYLASLAPEITFHGFDSFEGLPEDWRSGFPKGAFALDVLPEVRSNVKLYKGWFEDTVPEFAAAQTGHVSFLHLDADLYSSTKTVLDLLGDRLQAGSVIQFDEYFNYPGWEQGEFRAFEEFVSARGIAYEYLGYCDGPIEFEQVAVRILPIGGAGAAETPPE